MKYKKVRTIANAGLRIMPVSKGSVFMDMHKLDYERQRLEERLSVMEVEEKFMKAKVKVIKRTIGEAIADIKTTNSTHKAKATNKLKY